MFFRIRLKDANAAEDGRPVSEHWQEHISWCLDLVTNNWPDTPEVMDHMYKTCVTWVGRPKEYEKYFAGDASYNAFMSVLRRSEGGWEEYCTQRQRNWLENFDQRFKKSETKNMVSNINKEIEPDLKYAMQTVLDDCGRFLKEKTEENKELVRKIQELRFKREKEIEKISYKKQLEGLAIGICAGAILNEVLAIFIEDISIKLTIVSFVGFILFWVSSSAKD